MKRKLFVLIAVAAALLVSCAGSDAGMSEAEIAQFLGTDVDCWTLGEQKYVMDSGSVYLAHYTVDVPKIAFYYSEYLDAVGVKEYWDWQTNGGHVWQGDFKYWGKWVGDREFKNFRKVDDKTVSFELNDGTKILMTATVGGGPDDDDDATNNWAYPLK